uniref:Uncharacterized protein n=1 Tax=Panagrolaimus davidi TaxID=227884 RepID=A0A914PL62_9BILA
MVLLLPEENAELVDPTRTCGRADVVVNGEIDYERLNGKVLLVEGLLYFAGKWSFRNAGLTGISFEHSGFEVSPQFELWVSDHQNLSSVINRIVCSNLVDLKLCRMTIPFSDYKKLTGNKISSLDTDDVVVNDENGIKVGIDKLWKEVKNAKSVTHKFNDNESMHETAQKLAELSPFQNLDRLNLENIQDGFDLPAFYQFLNVMFLIF